MSTTTDIHPDAVLTALLAKGSRSHRRHNLEKVHEICRKQHASGSRDFSRSTIGRLCEDENVLKARVLYNAQFADYCAIIAAWAAYAGPPAPKQPEALASHEYLMRMPDPAIRFIIQSIIADRDKLQAQLNTMKSKTYITVDRRPLGATVISNPVTGPTFVLEMKAQLTPSERDALTKTISLEFLHDHDWREGSHGEILNKFGSTVFDVGFVTAIRKVLGNSKSS
jgi:hypothetical protein